MLAGELTICGITRPVSLQAEYLGHVAPRDSRRAVSRPTAPSTARLGVSAGTCPWAAAGSWSSREIRIKIDLEAVLQP
jgi:polyisoprenoid-binding protein YceI